LGPERGEDDREEKRDTTFRSQMKPAPSEKCRV